MPFPSLPSSSGLKQAWRRAAHDLFERDGLETLFSYARNLLTGTVIIAAGLRAALHEGDIDLPVGQWTLHRAGWLAVTIGAVMLVLNLAGGLRRLARRRSPMALRLLVLVLYVGISVRLIQVIVLFRYGGM